MLHGGDIYTDGIFKGRELLDYSSNINPLGIPTGLKQNINEALNNCTRYPDIEYRELKQNIKNYIEKAHRYFGGGPSEPVYSDEILLGNGASELIDLSIACFKSICIISPSFKEYEISAERAGLNISYSSLSANMEFDYEDILVKLQDVQALIIGNPNNPNGGMPDKKEFIKILDFCRENNKAVIVDEAFIEFTGSSGASFVSLINKYECLFIIRALTKFYGLPGIRFGYALSRNEKLINEIRKKQNPWNINSFAEAAVKYCFSDLDYIKRTIDWIESERQYLSDELREIRYIDSVYPTKCNFILCRLKNIDSYELYNKCLEKGLLIRMADNFRGLNKNFARFAVKDRKSNGRFIEILKKTGEEL